jgi:hypothetical protein
MGQRGKEFLLKVRLERPALNVVEVIVGPGLVVLVGDEQVELVDISDNFLVKIGRGKV